MYIIEFCLVGRHFVLIGAILSAEKIACNAGFVFHPAPLIPLVAKVVPIIDTWTSDFHTVRNHAYS
jgi:hypothetical protein